MIRGGKDIFHTVTIMFRGTAAGVRKRDGGKTESHLLTYIIPWFVSLKCGKFP